MNRWQVGILLLFGLVVCALPPCIDGQRSGRKLAEQDVRDDKGVQLSANDFSYVLRGKQRPCILANMIIDIAVPYSLDNKTNSTKSLQVAKDATVGGNCSAVISNLILSWKGGPNSDKNNMIQLIFINDQSKFSLFSINLNVYLDKDNFPSTAIATTESNKWMNATSNIDLRLFAASVTNGVHKCDKETKLNAGNIVIGIKNVSLIAFNTDDDLSTKKGEQCGENKDETKTFPYVLKNTDNSICALARVTASLAVSYKTKDSKNSNKTIGIPITADVTGKCNSAITSMKLIWSEESKTKSSPALGMENYIQFYFYKDNGTIFIDLLYINIFLDEKNFPDAANVNQKISQFIKLDTPLAPENGIYNCPKKVTLKITEEISMTLSDILLVAFDVEKDFASKKVGDCRASLSEDNFRYVVRDPLAEAPCVLANMSIDVRVPYRKATSNANATLTVPTTATTHGSCNYRSVMEISWIESVTNKTETNKITFYIATNWTHFFVYNVEGMIYLDEKHFPDAINRSTAVTGMTNFDLTLFAAPLAKGMYSCLNRTQEIGLKNFDLILTDVSFIAFNNDQYLDSKEVRSCVSPGDDSTTTSSTNITTMSTPSSPPVTAPTSATNPPEPVPSTGYDYAVVNETSHLPCIAANMSISVKIPFATKESNETGVLKVPQTAKTSGKCEEPKSTMRLTWSISDPTSKNESVENIVAVTFEKSESEYSIRSIDLDIFMDEKNFPGALEKRYKAAAENISRFSAPLHRIYKCQPEAVIPVKNAGLTISNVILTAFNTVNIDGLKTVNCVTRSSTNIGAIVGGVIAGIAVLALSAFVFAMYKKKRRLV